MFCSTAHTKDYKSVTALKKACAPYSRHICTWEYARVKERYEAGLDVSGGYENCKTLQGILIRELQLLEHGYID